MCQSFYDVYRIFVDVILIGTDVYPITICISYLFIIYSIQQQQQLTNSSTCK
jgi:hypothetical protein